MNSVLKMKSVLCALTTVAGLCAFAPAAHATTIADATNDFLSTFAGPHNADLDVVSAQATLGSGFIRLSATMAGSIGTTKVDGVANGVYVWGVDRGKGTEVLNQGPNPVGAGVKFDAIVVLFANGTGFVVPVNPDGTPADVPSFLAAGAVTIDGDTISVDVSLDKLPSTGADIDDYGFNIWPRIDDINSNDQVADFAPEGSTFSVSAVPEPASWALMMSGIGLAATLRRRRTLTA